MPHDGATSRDSPRSNGSAVTPFEKGFLVLAGCDVLALLAYGLSKLTGSVWPRAAYVALLGLGYIAAIAVIVFRL